MKNYYSQYQDIYDYKTAKKYDLHKRAIVQVTLCGKLAMLHC